ncbi:MAG TPA: hypothetical protein VMS37_25270 [Verrucomicrobiae bacterium]|nr:hypothetical protein [Verrucomicrobiae bacterium]
MPKRAGLILLLAFVAVFLILNHGAYLGWFQDDEIDNLSWTPFLSSFDFLKGALSPFFYPNNFRPVGHYYFHAVEAVAGLNFPVYVGVLEAFHLLNVCLLWAVMRRLGAGTLSAAAACCFFGLHMALFDNFWKPMYVFDVLCSAFSLAALWCWLRERWIASFLAFWLAYKCKELAVMLPLVLLCCELWFGKRRWKHLLPFFAVSVSFGLQSLLQNPNRDNDYTFRFTPDALAKTIPYYAGRVFLVPWLGLLVPVLALTARRRRVWFGLAMAALFFVPLAFLPGRIFSAYCYLPFAGLAIALSGVESAALAAAVLLWMPWNIHELRVRQRETLARDSDIRAWMAAAQRFASSGEKVDAFIFSGAPAEFHQWGIEGALKYFYARTDLAVRWVEDPQAKHWMATRRVALIEWDPARKRADVRVVGPL